VELAFARLRSPDVVFVQDPAIGAAPRQVRARPNLAQVQEFNGGSVSVRTIFFLDKDPTGLLYVGLAI
jgi:hypothetical protein